MKRQTKKEQAKQYAEWIWRNPNVKLFTCNYGKSYGFAIATESGSAEKSLTPYKPIGELLAYLQGVWMAKQTPENYKLI